VVGKWFKPPTIKAHQ